MFCLLMNGFFILSVTGVVAGDTLPKPSVYIPQGIESVNGSNIDMMCSHGENCLLDGHSPYIDTSLVNWASNLVTVRKNVATDDIGYDHVVLTFAFDEDVTLTGLEIDLFLCPEWGIHAPFITIYGSNISDFILYPSQSRATNGDFIRNYEPSHTSCDCLSTVVFPFEIGESSSYPIWHIVVSFSSFPNIIEWVHVGEVRFLNMDGVTSATFCSAVPPPGDTPSAYIPQGIESVNGSNIDMMCSHGENCLLDGHSPYIDTSLVNWASNLVTVRKNDPTDDIYYDHVVLTFSFEKCVKMAAVEVDFFLCPQWGIHAPYLTLYCSDTSEFIVSRPGNNYTTLTNDRDFISNYEPTVCGCQSLSTVRIPVQRGEPAHPFWHIVVSFPSPYQDIEWVHVEEVRLVLKLRKAHDDDDDDGEDREQPTTSCRTEKTYPIQTDSVLLTTNVPNTTVHLMTNVPISTKQIPTNITNLFTKTNVPNPTVQMSINPSVPGKLSSNDISLPDSTNNETLPSISQTAVSTPSIYQSTIKSFTTAYSAFATTLLKSTKSVLVPTRPTSLISTNSKSSNPTHRLPFVTTAILSTAVPQSSEPGVTTAILSTAVPQSSEPGITTEILSTTVPQSSEPGITTAILSTTVPHGSDPGITAAILPTAVPQSSEPGITTAILSTAVPQSSEPGITTAILSTVVPQSSEPGVTTAILPTAVPQSSEPGVTTAILSTAVPQSSQSHVTTDMLAPPTSSIMKPSSTISLSSSPNPSIGFLPNPTLSTVLDSESDHFIGTSISYTQGTQSISNNNNGVPPTNTKAENVTPLITSHTTLQPPNIGFPDIDGIDNEQTRKNEVPLLLIVAIAVLIGLCLLVLVALLIMGARLRQRERVKLLTTFPNNGPQIPAYNPLYVSPSVIAETVFNDSISHLDLAGEHAFDVKNDASLLQLSTVVHSSNDSS